MYRRELQTQLSNIAKLYPLIGITGPRQSGKTTIAKKVFADLPYVSLENPDIRERAIDDPRNFLRQYKDGAIFDEVQNTPKIFSYLQEIADNTTSKGKFILTGSQNFSLSQHISQSLSGRIGMSSLLPLSIKELGEGQAEINKLIYYGGYPGLHQLSMNPIDFYTSYIQTYLERDVRLIKNISNQGKFRNFIKLCAARIGQVINFSSLADDAGISHTTAREWLNILEATYIIFFVQPYYQNFNKRLIKMPKLYFYDTGLACSLLGLEKWQQLNTHYLRGGLFENLTILEIVKLRLNRGMPTNIYFWRDKAGREIDLLGEWGGKISAFEIKSSATLKREFLKNLKYFANLLSSKSLPIDCYLIYTGEERGLYGGVSLYGIDDLGSCTK